MLWQKIFEVDRKNQRNTFIEVLCRAQPPRIRGVEEVSKANKNNLKIIKMDYLLRATVNRDLSGSEMYKIC